MSKRNEQHRGSYLPEYLVWCNMRYRCTNPKHPKYPRYGGRGIVVCARWMDSFASFLQDVGQRPFVEASIGRIDNDGNYEPGNVRWETRKQQQRNMSSNRMVTIEGKTQPVSAWEEESGINRGAVRYRVRSGVDGPLLLKPPGYFGHKLTADQVAAIRAIPRVRGQRKTIAERFGVSVSMITKILTDSGYWRNA